MADDSLNILNCDSPSVVEPRPPDDVLAAFYSVAQSLLPGLNIPYNLGSPLRNSAATSSPNYDLKLPAGVTIPKIDDPSATSMLGFLVPVMNAITMGLAILGPVKVVIDIIIAIINVLCAIPNPLKIAEALAALFIALIPLLGLFPATAGLQVLLETVKSVIMILTSILMQILPKIDLVIENVETAIAHIQGNNPAGADGAVQKICVVLQTLLDDLAVLSPINKILDLINSFMGLAVGGICAPGGGCCDDCPSIVRTPPSGSCTQESFDTTANTTTLRLQTAFWTENYLGASPVGVTVGNEIPVARLIDPILLLLGQQPAATNDAPLGSHLIDLATFAPSMFQVTFDFRARRSRPSTATASGTQVTIEMTSDHGFSAGDIIEVAGGWLDGVVDGRHTITSLTDDSFSYESEAFAFIETRVSGMTVRKVYNVLSATLAIDDTNIILQDVLITIPTVLEDTPSDYFMFADESAVLSAELMTQGCVSSVSNARDQYEDERDSDFPTAIRTNNGGTLPPNAGFNSPPDVLLGAEIPRIDEDGIKQIVVDFAANPAAASRAAVFDKINLEIDRFRDIAARSLCVLVSSANSLFTSDRQVLDFSSGVCTITYQPRSRDNQPLLIGLPNNVDVNSVFTTSFGTLGPVSFDPSTGSYTATLTADTAGIASVRAFFVTTDVCNSPRSANSPLQLDISFLDGTARPQRKDRKYIQSAGGRRR